MARQHRLIARRWLSESRVVASVASLRNIAACFGMLAFGATSVAEEIVPPMRLGDLSGCGSLRGESAPILVVLHSDYLQSWYDRIAPDIEEGLTRWRRMAAPAGRLPSASAARQAASLVRSAIDAAVNEDRGVFDAAGCVLSSGQCAAELRLVAIGRHVAVWNLPDFSGIRLGDPVELVKNAGLPWCETTDESVALVQAMQSWPESMRKRASLILNLPVAFAEGASEAGISGGMAIDRLGQFERDELGAIGTRAMREAADSLDNWWRERVDRSFQDGAVLAAHPVLARIVKLAVCRISGDPEMRAIAARELAALRLLGQVRREGEIDATVAESCRLLAEHDSKLQEALGAARPRREQSADQQAAVSSPSWVSAWKQSVEALEVRARKCIPRAAEDHSRGSLVMQEWGRALGSASAVGARSLIVECNWAEWAEPILSSTGRQIADWESIAKRAEQESRSPLAQNKYAEILYRSFSAVEQEDGERPDVSAIEQAKRALPTEIRSQAIHESEALRRACVNTGLSVSEADAVASAWMRQALLRIRVTGSRPADLYHAADHDLLTLAMREGIAVDSLSDPRLNEYAMRRLALIEEHVHATAELAWTVALDGEARLAGESLDAATEHAADAARARADALLRRLVALNAETVLLLAAHPEPPWQQVVETYERGVAIAPAAVAAVVDRTASGLADDREVRQQLDELRHARLQRLLTTEPAEIMRLDRKAAWILAQLAARLDEQPAP